MDMRVCLLCLSLLLASCEDRDAAPVHDAGVGEARARMAAGGGAPGMRSGAKIPVALPPGLTIYPGARVLGNTVVERGGSRRMLIEFETPDPISKVMLFHRAQAQAAGASLTLDLDGTEAASIGGRTAGGGDFALTARRSSGRTLVQLSASDPAASDAP